MQRFDTAIFTELDRWTRLEDRHFDAWRNWSSYRENRLVHPNRLLPLTLYLYLKARFGKPVGFMMVARSPKAGNNLFDWHFTIAHEERVIHFVSGVSGLEITVQGPGKPTESDWELLVNSILADYKNYGPKISELRDTLERYDIFVNPYARLSRIIISIVSKLESKSLPDFPKIDNSASSDNLRESFDTYIREFDELRAYSMFLQMAAPVWGEAFVNMLIFLLARPEVKKNRRHYESILREQIDIRTSALHLNCMGFVSPVDIHSEAFKQFHTLMNHRNDLLHGNIDPASLKFGEVFYDELSYDGVGHEVALFKDEMNLVERLTIGRASSLKPHLALSAVRTVQGFVEVVLTHLNATTLDQLRTIMDDETPGFCSRTGRIGILFPKELPVLFRLGEAVPHKAEATGTAELRP